MRVHQSSVVMKLKINYLGVAGGAWAAAAFVAGGGTRVTTVWT